MPKCIFCYAMEFNLCNLTIILQFPIIYYFMLITCIENYPCYLIRLFCTPLHILIMLVSHTIVIIYVIMVFKGQMNRRSSSLDCKALFTGNTKPLN